VSLTFSKKCRQAIVASISSLFGWPGPYQRSLILRLSSSLIWLFPVALIYGLGHGGLFTAISPSVAEYFGMKSHGAIFGTVVFFGTISGAAGPIVAGMLFDRFQTYDLAFTILAALAAAGMLFAWSLPRQHDTRATVCLGHSIRLKSPKPYCRCFLRLRGYPSAAYHSLF